MVRRFKKTQVKSGQPLGKIFARARERLGLTTVDVEAAIGVRAKYLRALEEARHDGLPAPVYVHGFLLRYAQFLGLPSASVLERYREEHPDLSAIDLTPKQAARVPTFVLTPKLLMIAASALAVVALFSYLTVQVGRLAREPLLVIDSPNSATSVASDRVMVRGHTDQTAVVAINSKIVNVADDGTFQTEVSLGEGLNRVEVVATSRTKKTTEKTIDILRKNL